MRKEYNFESPELVAILLKKGAGPNDLFWEEVFQLGLNQLDRPYTTLPIFVKPAHLKKMLTAIKLTDVRGMYISEDYQKRAKLLADTVETKDSGSINIVSLKGKKYVGINILGKAVRSLLKELDIKPRGCKITLLGRGTQLREIKKELKALSPSHLVAFTHPANRQGLKKSLAVTNIFILAGPSSFDPSLNISLPKGAILIDLREGLFKRYPKRITGLGRRLIPSKRYIAHIAAHAIKAWAGRKIDTRRLLKSI